MWVIFNFNSKMFSGIKLEAQPLTIATALTLYHKFFKEADSTGYDRYVRPELYI